MASRILLYLVVCGEIFLLTGGVTLEGHRQRRSPESAYAKYRSFSPSDRPGCQPGAEIPQNRVNTTERLRLLRGHFDRERIDAYIVPSEDAHQSEYPSDYDLRRGYISGLSGSAGQAVILRDVAALWTDGRYFIQAENEMDCNWVLMKMGVEGVPTMTEWLIAMLGPINGTVGADPFLVRSSKWVSMEDDLKKKSVSMQQITPDLVDRDWTTANGRPPQPNTPINALPLQFAGKTWQDKVREVQDEMADFGADSLIVSGLDETAWIFNLRAADIQYNPFFLSYVIIERNSKHPILFIKDHLTKLRSVPTDNETTINLMTHLNTNATGQCVSTEVMCVKVMEYSISVFESQLMSVVSRSNIVWISVYANYAIYVKVSQNKLFQEKTPIAVSKAQKNPIEREGMKNSHRRDAVALISFLAKLEKEVKAGELWTEVSAAKELKRYREGQLYSRGLSFGSISGSGSNGAIIHYVPSNLTDKRITTDQVYLLDSGGQYLDGTTDVTRTLHFGTPSDYEKECYTRVFMGHCDLARIEWQYGLYGRDMDLLARRPLWEAGLIYRHGTGHGIGMYLSVHEGPGWISLSHSSYETDEMLKEHQCFSDEPGYYEEGLFGMRLENINMIKKVVPKYNTANVTFLGFEPITLVPYEPNLLQYDLLDDQQIEWLNKYNKKIRDEMGPLLRNNKEAYDWMFSRTANVTKDSKCQNTNSITRSGTNNIKCTKYSVCIFVITFIVFIFR